MKLHLIILLLMAAPALSAQMSLNDCLIYARDHAHRNIISGIEVKQASADSRMAASDLMPTVSLSSNGNVSFGRNIDPETNTYDNRKTLYSGFGLQMSLPVFDGLVSINNLKAARTGKLRKMESARVEQDNISLQVIRSFYNVSYCKAMVEQMKEQLERDLNNLKATEKGQSLGTKSGADVAEMKALVASDEYELTNQQSLLSKAYLQLRKDMGMSLDSIELDLQEEDYTAQTDETFEHPKISEARLALKESRYYHRAAKGAFSPRISLNAGISTSYYKIFGNNFVNPGFSRQWHDNMGQYVGFSVSIPVFIGLSRVNRVKKAGLEVDWQQSLLDEARYEVEHQMSEARLDLISASKEQDAARARYEAEEIAYRAIQRKFDLGSASAIDLYTSGAKLATARANLEGKRIQKIISRIVLGYYNGEKLIK